LDARGDRPACREALRAGIEFLHRKAQAAYQDELPDDIPVGIELTLPRVLEEAASAGHHVSLSAYAAFFTQRARRMKRIAQIPIRAGTPPVHSWEGWGVEPVPELQDASGGLGNSPSATAAFCHRASRVPELAAACVS